MVTGGIVTIPAGNLGHAHNSSQRVVKTSNTITGRYYLLSGYRHIPTVAYFFCLDIAHFVLSACAVSLTFWTLIIIIIVFCTVSTHLRYNRSAIIINNSIILVIAENN